MAINKKLIFWKSATFNPPTSSTDTTKDVLWSSIVFFGSTAGTYANSIWTHGQVFSAGTWGTNQTNYVPLTLSGTTYNLSKDGHTHNYLPLSGGILTGQINLTTTTITTPPANTIALAAKSDGLYQKIGTVETKLALTTDLTWANITSKPATIAGYGIIDAYDKATTNTNFEIRRPYNGVYNNLGSPTVREAALFHGQMNNKFRFIPAQTQEESTDGITWTASTRANSNQLADLMLGEGQSTAVNVIPAPAIGGTGYYRLTWDSSQTGYVYLSELYIYNSTSGNNVKFKVEGYQVSNSNWIEITSGTINNWPGHTYIPHTSVPFHPTANTNGFYRQMRITFSIESATYTNPFTIYSIEWFGGYPAGRRNVESYDRNKNVTFPANVFATSFIGALTGNAATATKLSSTRTFALTGDVAGSVSNDLTSGFSIATTLANSGVTAGTYRSVTVDAKGRVTAGTNPTTVAEYGLTDVVTTNTTQTISGDKTFNSEVLGNNGLRVNNTGGAGVGISLYGSSATNPTYGLMFATTANKGKHGAVTGDWATYFTMSPTAGRGWIFTTSATGTTDNVASISNTGTITASTFVGALSGNASSATSASQLDTVDVGTVMASIKSGFNITGGGTISVSAGGYIKNTSRFIVISNGRGSHFSASGFFDISIPTSGTITGVGGAANKTATADGIPLAMWESLYYILPIGYGNTSVDANFRVCGYTADFEIPSTWVLLATYNGDTGQKIHILGGKYKLELGESIDTTIYDAKYAQTAGNATTATNLASITTTFTGTWPVTVNVNGTIYSHTGLTFTGSTGTLTSSIFSGSLSGNATTATSTTLVYRRGDHRSGFKPSDVPGQGLVQTFATQGALNSQTNDGDYSDVIAINSYQDSSAGSVNALSFDKSSYRINHFMGTFGATTWLGHKTLAYTDGTGASGNWGINITGTATSFTSDRTNYKGVTDGSVAGQLMWKNYGNHHTIFDASNSTTPSNTSCNNTDSVVPWATQYPVLMGWNGSDTYGVRVDSARLADNATNILNNGTVTLASGAQNNSIFATTTSLSSGQPVRLLNFDWFSNIMSIGNIRAFDTNSLGFGFYYTASGGSLLEIGRLTKAGALSVISTMTATAFYESSDMRLKTNIKSLDTDVIDLIFSEDFIKSFNWKENNVSDYGVIAQHIETYFPDLVSTSDTGFKHVKYSAVLSMIMGASIKKIKSLEERITNLENK